MSKIRSLDHYYIAIQKILDLVVAFTEDREIGKIIQMCRMKPYPALPIFNLRMRLKKCWVDEYGNTLRLHKKIKEFSITLDDREIDRRKLICTDLYSGLPIHKIYNMSRMMVLISGVEDSKDREPFRLLTFLGLDDYLRCFALIDGRWEDYPPMFLGLSLLRKIAKLSSFKPFGLKTVEKWEALDGGMLPPLRGLVSCAGSIPVQEKMMDILEKADLLEELRIKKDNNGQE